MPSEGVAAPISGLGFGSWPKHRSQRIEGTGLNGYLASAAWRSRRPVRASAYRSVFLHRTALCHNERGDLRPRDLPC